MQFLAKFFTSTANIKGMVALQTFRQSQNESNFNTILPYFSSNITIRNLYCNFKCSHMLCSSIVIQITWIQLSTTSYILKYSMKTLHWYFPWATALHLYNMIGTGGKLQQLHCYHPFSDSLDIYLTKNHYGNYSPKMVPIAKIWGSGSWTTGSGHVFHTAWETMIKSYIIS